MPPALLNPAQQAFIDNYRAEHQVDIAPPLLDETLNEDFDRLLQPLLSETGEGVVAAVNAICEMQAQALHPAYVKWLKGHLPGDTEGYEHQLGRLVAQSLAIIFQDPDITDELEPVRIADGWLYDLSRLNPSETLDAEFGYFEVRPGECIRANQEATREKFKLKGFADNQLDYIDGVLLEFRAVLADETPEAHALRFITAVDAMPTGAWPEAPQAVTIESA